MRTPLPDRPPDRVRAWEPGVPGIAEVFHATYLHHRYPRHCHDTWTVLIVDAGVVRYDLHRHQRGADARLVTVLPPFVAHDGRSGHDGRGFRKRVLYLDRDTLGDRLVGAAVDGSSIRDLTLRTAISRLHDRLDAVTDADDLECESRLATIVDRITTHLDGGRPEPPVSGAAADALRERLDDDPFGRHRLGDIAAELGWSATHLIRSFTDAYGLAPHQYLVARRVAAARRLLLAGQPAARAAVAVGFHDQAHLTRHFRRHVGTTPARFQRSRRGAPRRVGPPRG